MRVFTVIIISNITHVNILMVIQNKTSIQYKNSENMRYCMTEQILIYSKFDRIIILIYSQSVMSTFNILIVIRQE